MLGVLKLGPLLNTPPPLEAAYHLYVDALVEPDADKVTVPVPHRALLVTEASEGIGLTVAVTAVLDPSQPVVEL